MALGLPVVTSDFQLYKNVIEKLGDPLMHIIRNSVDHGIEDAEVRLNYNKNKLGNITYYDSSGQSDYNFSKPYSEDTAQIIDKEISVLIEKQYQRAQQILKKHKKELIILAELLSY